MLQHRGRGVGGDDARRAELLGQTAGADAGTTPEVEDAAYLHAVAPAELGEHRGGLVHHADQHLTFELGVRRHLGRVEREVIAVSVVVPAMLHAVNVGSRVFERTLDRHANRFSVVDHHAAQRHPAEDFDHRAGLARSTAMRAALSSKVVSSPPPVSSSRMTLSPVEMITNKTMKLPICHVPL